MLARLREAYVWMAANHPHKTNGVGFVLDYGLHPETGNDVAEAMRSYYARTYRQG